MSLRYAPSLQRNGSAKRFALSYSDKEASIRNLTYGKENILTNDYTSTDREVVEYYNKRGGAERILDDMNKQNQDIRIQICICPRKMDQDCKAAHTEHIHKQ